MSPFITQERRDVIKERTLSYRDCQPGDYCYMAYKEMVEEWKANPSWTTAHNIYKDVIQDCSIAKDLAWQCFFYFHVLKYEEKKRDENGDIE